MMNNFQSGPFSFAPGRTVQYNGQITQKWTLHYGNHELAVRQAPAGAIASQVRAVFAGDISSFALSAQEAHAPDELLLIEYETDEVVGRLAVATWPDLTPGLTDDRSRFWLLSPDRLRSMPVTLTQFGRIAAKHAAPENHWLTGLLPDDVMTDDADWRAPTSWELRHVVGEGSFTGITGARAAEIVGISPQNFRKYTAQDGAKNRQSISRSAWFQLLKALEVIK